MYFVIIVFSFLWIADGCIFYLNVVILFTEVI